MASQVDPSNQNIHFDYSRSEASYGNYTNMGQHGVINNIYQSPRSSPLGMIGFRLIYQ